MGIGRGRAVLHVLTHPRAAHKAHEKQQSHRVTDILPRGNDHREANRLANPRAQGLTHSRAPGSQCDVEDKNPNHNPFRCPNEAHLYIFVIFFYPVKTMSLNYGSLEEVHGAPFGTRVPVTQEQTDSKLDKPVGQQQARTMSDRMQAAVASVTPSLPLDTNPATESFTIRQVERPAPVVERMKVQETFVDRGATSHADAAAEEKLSRILRLIEQNRTGYEKPAVQDMVLYIFTGVFFLFTFDTFVQLGKGMRPIKKSRKA